MYIFEWISQPWHWSISGLAIAFVLFLMMYFGERFGISTSFQTLCSIGGARRWSDYFDLDWRKYDWLLVFVVGSIIGGAIAANFITDDQPLVLANATIADLQQLGIDAPKDAALLPGELFSTSSLMSFGALFLLVLGGFLVGFGARYAGGCTSGHAISGLANFQLPSLVAVVGFFIGGLLMTHVFFPYLFMLL